MCGGRGFVKGIDEDFSRSHYSDLELFGEGSGAFGN